MQVDVHSGGDIDGVSVQGHRDRRRVGPDAWDEGWLVTSASFPAVSSSFESEILLSLSCHGYLQPGPDSIGIIAISHGCAGVAARACGLVGMEPAKVSVFASLLPCIPMWLATCIELSVELCLSRLLKSSRIARCGYAIAVPWKW